jgi:hypothetical protein
MAKEWKMDVMEDQEMWCGIKGQFGFCFNVINPIQLGKYTSLSLCPPVLLLLL